MNEKAVGHQQPLARGKFEDSPIVAVYWCVRQNVCRLVGENTQQGRKGAGLAGTPKEADD